MVKIGLEIDDAEGEIEHNMMYASCATCAEVHIDLMKGATCMQCTYMHLYALCSAGALAHAPAFSTNRNVHDRYCA